MRFCFTSSSDWSGDYILTQILIFLSYMTNMKDRHGYETELSWACHRAILSIVGQEDGEDSEIWSKLMCVFVFEILVMSSRRVTVNLGWWRTKRKMLDLCLKICRFAILLSFFFLVSK
jgi:hypothetical protein